MVRVPRALAPLRHPEFRLFTAGQLTSNVGDAFYGIALPWYVLAHQGGPLLLGVVLAAYGIPRTVLLAVGGHASDRWRPWTVMMAADAVRAVAVAAMAIMAVAGPANPYLLVPAAAVLGAGAGIFVPGSFAIVPSLLPDEDLQAGNALTFGGTQLAALIGPAAAGAVVALVGPGAAFSVDAASFAVSTLTLAGIRIREAGAEVLAPEDPRSPTLRRLVASERVLQVILILLVAANLGSGGMSEVALPALAHGPLHAGASGYGGLIAGFGAGALLGTLVAAQARRARFPAVVACVAFLLEAACMAATPYVGGIIPAGAALFAVGAFNSFGNVIVVTALQRWAPRRAIGRLMGLLMFAAMGVFPMSVLVAGLVVDSLGPAAFFPLAAATVAGAVVAGLTQRSWRTFGASSDRVGG